MLRDEVKELKQDADGRWFRIYNDHVWNPGAPEVASPKTYCVRCGIRGIAAHRWLPGERGDERWECLEYLDVP